jgi:hypothetical protein
MAIRGQSITLTYTAWNKVLNQPQTGDGPNHSLKWVKDGVESALTATPTEKSNGEYSVTISVTDADANAGKLTGSSSTSNVLIIPVQVAFVRLPSVAPGANGGLPTVDANNAVKVQSGTGANQLSLDNGRVTLSPGGLQHILVGGVRADVALDIIAALVAGKISGAGSGTEVFKSLDKTTTRATVSADNTGNRTDVIYNTTP